MSPGCIYGCVHTLTCVTLVCVGGYLYLYLYLHLRIYVHICWMFTGCIYGCVHTYTCDSCVSGGASAFVSVSVYLCICLLDVSWIYLWMCTYIYL